MTDYQIKDKLGIMADVGADYIATVNTDDNKATFSPTEEATRYAYFGIATIDKNGTLEHFDTEPFEVTAGDKLCRIMQYGVDNVAAFKYKFLWAVEPTYDADRNRHIFLTNNDFAANNDGNTEVILESGDKPKITNIKIFRVALDDDFKALLDNPETTNDDIVSYIKNNQDVAAKVLNISKTYHDALTLAGDEYEITAQASDDINQYLITQRATTPGEQAQYPGLETKIGTYEGILYSPTTAGMLGDEINTNTFQGILLKNVIYENINFEGNHYITGGSAAGAQDVDINESIVLQKGLTNEVIQSELTILDNALKIEEDETVYESQALQDTITVNALAATGGGEDIVYGTDGNDWIDAGVGSDIIFGGNRGNDILSGHTAEDDEGDLIVAGKAVKPNEGDITISLENKQIGVELNTDRVEIYGTNGADTIYGSKGGGHIDSHKGNDKIYITGGTNEIVLSDASSEDNKIVYGASANDKLILPKVTLDELQFNKNGDDLVIEDKRATGNTFSSVTVAGFFASESKLDNFYVLNNAGDDIVGPYKISDQYITVSFDGDKPINYSANTGFKEIIIGSTQNDTITDGIKDDIIYTNGGSDTINLKNGGNNIVSADNNSTVTVNIESGENEITSYAGDDKFNIKGGINKINAGDGKDVFNITYGADDTIYGEAGDDVFTISGKDRDGNPTVIDDSIDGGEGNDKFIIKMGATLNIEAGSGNDTITVSGGDDNEITASSGDNTINVSGGTFSYITAGAGNDTISITGGGLNTYDGGNGKNVFNISGGVGDAISGGNDNDVFNISGSTRHDSIAGGAGNDTYNIKGGEENKIVAGNGNNTFTVSGGETIIDTGNGKNTATISAGVTEFYSGTDIDSVIIKGGTNIVKTNAGADNITISGGNNEIFAQAGDDIINITGGATVFNMAENDGVDKLTGASAKDSIITGDGFDKLSFARQDNSLLITSNADDATCNATLVDFFVSKSKLDKIVANNIDKSILNDAVISVNYTDTTKKLFQGTDYNETINIGNDSAEVTMGKGNNTIILNENYTGLTTVTLTQGEILTIKDTAMKDLAHADATHKVEARQRNNSKDMELTITNGDYVGRIILKNAYGETGATVKFDNGGEDFITFYDMVDGFKIDASVAQQNNGIVKGSDVSERFDMSGYVSETAKGVTLTSGAGDDSVTGSDYNDSVNIKSGNNTIEETIGVNNIKTGAGNDTFKANAGTSTNTVNLGEGNNKATLQNSGTNRVTSGKGNDIVEIENKGTNILNIGAGQNEVVIAAGSTATNTITSGKDKDIYTIGANTGENIIKSGAGSDEFNIRGGVNKITATGAKTEAATVNIQGGVNNIKTGAGSDGYDITGGTNIIDSGAGIDTFEIKTAYSTNTIKTGADNDQVTIDTASTNIIDTGAGHDRVDITDTQATGELSYNDIKLGAGSDYVWVKVNSVNNIDLGAGNDSVAVDAGTNIINGGTGDDIIWLDGGTNVVYGGAGDDFFRIEKGVNTIFGGAGKDTYQVSGFNFANTITITDTQGVSTFAFMPKTNTYAYSFFANLTNITSATSYTKNGYTITKDTVEAGEITGYNANTISVDLGKNKQANIYYDNYIDDLPCDLNKLASDVASWIVDKNQGYTSVDDVLASADAAEFLQTFAVDTYNQPV